MHSHNNRVQYLIGKNSETLHSKLRQHLEAQMIVWLLTLCGIGERCMKRLNSLWCEFTKMFSSFCDSLDPPVLDQLQLLIIIALIYFFLESSGVLCEAIPTRHKFCQR
jgi:hypothetical protein